MPLPPATCPVCGTTYVPYRIYQRACSRRCHDRLPDRVAVHRAYNALGAVRERKNAARRVGNNPARRAVNLRRNLSLYGLTPEIYQERLAEQDGVCHLCGKPPKPNGVRSAARLHVDHDHETGTIRKLLCLNCNRGIGYLLDDPDLMERAAAYVRSYR